MVPGRRRNRAFCVWTRSCLSDRAGITKLRLVAWATGVMLFWILCALLGIFDIYAVTFGLALAAAFACLIEYILPSPSQPAYPDSVKPASVPLAARGEGATRRSRRRAASPSDLRSGLEVCPERG